jgi:hypothetical protein
MDIERQAGPRPVQHVVAASEDLASEKDVRLGSTLLREIDKGLAKSRVGI